MSERRIGTVRELWRYPVKSMGGESLSSCLVEERGLTGDRAFAIYDKQGHIGSGKITRRFRPIAGLRRHAARLEGSALAIVAPDGAAVSADDAALTQSLGQQVSLAPERDVSHQDCAPVHLLSMASLAWVSGRVGRALSAFEFRPNIVFDTQTPWPAEQDWCDRTLAIGASVRLLLTEATERCIMVDVREDGVDARDALPVLTRENDRNLGVYAQVIASGTVRVGDAMSLLA